MKNWRVWQGTDAIFNISHDYTDLVTATAIEVYVDTPSQIVKTLSDGVTSVSATNMVVTLAAGDTDDVDPGEYCIQARITTTGGQQFFGRILPERVKILESNWGSGSSGSY